MNVDDQSPEYQIFHWKHLAMFWQSKSDAFERSYNKEKKRRTTEHLKELEQENTELRKLIERNDVEIAALRKPRDDLMKRYEEAMQRLYEYEHEQASAIAKIIQERDHWRDRWREATKSIGRLMEHQGNVELLEHEINTQLRTIERLKKG